MISLGSIRRRLRKVLDKLIEIVSRITRRVECFFFVLIGHILLILLLSSSGEQRCHGTLQGAWRIGYWCLDGSVL